jgi:hypothetical protein
VHFIVLELPNSYARVTMNAFERALMFLLISLPDVIILLSDTDILIFLVFKLILISMTKVLYQLSYMDYDNDEGNNNNSNSLDLLLNLQYLIYQQV